MDTTEQQFLTFSLGMERFALSVDSVREVLEPRPTTKIPSSASHLKGIMEVRGGGVPVLDLRTLFGLSEAPRTAQTAIIVVECGRGEATGFVGLVCDAVHEVVFLDAARIEPAPKLGAGLSSGCLRGIGRRDASFVLVLDLEELLRGGLGGDAAEGIDIQA